MQREADHITGVNVALRKNPFALGHVDCVLPAGITIAEMINEVGLRQTDELIGGVFVYVGDMLIERQRWMDYTLTAGLIVSIGIVPSGGGGGGKDPTRTVAMLAVMAIAIAATVAAPYAAPFLGISSPMGAALLGAFAGATVSLAGSMLVNALIPLPSQKSGSDASRNYITGISNVMDPYGPVPRIYGKRRVYPRIAAQPYSELLGNDEQYLRVLFCVGKGRYHLSDYKIGETALTEFEDYELDKYNSSNTLTSSLYPNDISETALTIELEYNSAQTRTTGEDVDEIQVEVTFPEGLYRISDGGERRSASVAIKCEYSLTGADTWREFSAFTRLNFTDYPSNDIAAGQSITGPSGSGTVRYANKNWYQHPTGDFIDDGEGLNVPIYETIEYCDYVDVEVASGTFSVSDSVTIDSTYTASVSAVSTITPTIEEEIGQPFKRSWTVKVPRDQYDVRVTRTTDDEDKTYRSAYWTTLRTITNEPPWTLTGCTMLALRIKASGQLSGMLDTFNFWAEALVDAYDSVTETWQIVKSRSPAWAFVDVLCGSSNLRPLAKSRLNLTSILEFQSACTAKNFNYDAVIDSRTTVWELLRQICAVGRAAPALTDNTYGVVLDKEQTTPVQHFSPRNSWGFSGSRVFVDVPHGLRCKFDNYNHDNAADERVVYDDGYTSANATLFESVEFPGVTLPGHVWKLGRYHLACLRLRPETYVFNTDVEHMVCTRGDLVRLTHDVLMVGLGQARVKSITTTSVSLDDVFQQQTGTTYGIQFRRADGTFTTATIVTINGDNAAGTVFTISPAMAAGDLPAVGDLCFFGVSGSESNDVLVSRIEPGPDLSAKITCIPYNDGILTADSGEIPDWDSGITLPPGYKRKPYKAKIIGAEYKYRENYVLTDGRYAIRIRVGFSVQESGFEGTGAVIDPFVQAIRQPVAFRPQYREDDGPWTPLPKVDADARHFGFKAKNNTSYDIRMRSIGLYGTVSDWDTLSNFETALVSVPPDVTGLQVVGGGTAWNKRALNVEWTEVTADDGEAEVTHYQVQVYTSDGNTLIRTERAMENKFSYTYSKNLDDGGPRAAVQIRVKARNSIKTLSATAASEVFTNAAPAAPTNLNAEIIVNGCQFEWDDNSEKDFSYFAYRIKIGDSAWNAWRQTPDSSKIKILTDSRAAEFHYDVPVSINVKAVDIYDQESEVASVGLVVEDVFVDESNDPSGAEFGDYSGDGYGDNTLKLYGQTQTYVGAHGANMLVDQLYLPVGIKTIRFDYYHAQDIWTDDDFTDAQTFVALLSPDYTLNTANWGYNLPVADDWIKLYMRQLATAKVNVSTSEDGGIVDATLTGLNSGTYAFNAYRLVINWDNSTLSVWVNGTRVATDVAFSSAIATNLAAGYKIMFHSHSYTGAGGTGIRYFRNIMIHDASPWLPSPSISPSASRSPSLSASRSVSASRSPSASLSPSISASRSASASVSPSASLSPSLSASASPSASVSPSASLSPSLSESSSQSASVSPSSSASPST